MRLQDSLSVRQMGEALAYSLRKSGPGVLRVDGRTMRIDAAVATAFVARELEHVKSLTYDIKKVALRCRDFFPVSHEGHPGAEVISYDQYDSFGEAEITDNYDGDSPAVDAEKQNFGAKVFGLRDHYTFSLQDFRAIAMSGSRLSEIKPMQARRGIEAKLEKIVALGVPQKGVKGVLNHASVGIFPETPAFTWATPGRTMYRFLQALAQQVLIQSSQTEMANAILIAPSLYELCAGTPFGNEDGEKSVLQAFVDNSPTIDFVDQWVQLTGAGAGGLDRAMAYRKDPAVVEVEITQEYEELAPEVRGMRYITECHMRTAGSVVRYPLAMLYADFTADTEEGVD